MTDEVIQREDTMIYRAPVPESETVTEVWGKQVETKVVDAPEVDGYLADGWVRHPDHIDNPPPPPAAVTKANGEIDALKAENADLKARIAALEAELKAAEELLAGAKEQAKQPTLGGKAK